jgi:flagellar biosynthesis protein FliR
MPVVEQFITLHVMALILTFVRLGTAVMIMPGVGDSFVPSQIRLYFALAFSLVVMPIVANHLPNPLPTGPMFFALIIMEFMVGALIGTFARILMSATDTAGMMVSFQAGLSNAQLFNPMMAGQGSLIGAFFSISAAALLFALNLHHLLIVGLIDSYDLFPVGEMPDVGSMAEVIVNAVAAAFMIATQMAAPFLILILILYAAMGILSKLMPQLQIFLIAMPLQIMLSLLILTLTISATLLYFTEQYRDLIGQFLGG